MDHRGSFETQLDRLWVIGSAMLETLPAQRWQRLLTNEARELLEELSERFAVEEKAGYLAPLVSERPELLRDVEKLRAEHGAILDQVAMFSEQVAGSTTLDAARERLRELVGKIRRHEHDEIALLQEATLTDVGVVD